jgi:hypothetical protein
MIVAHRCSRGRSRTALTPGPCEPPNLETRRAVGPPVADRVGVPVWLDSGATPTPTDAKESLTYRLSCGGEQAPPRCYSAGHLGHRGTARSTARSEAIGVAMVVLEQAPGRALESLPGGPMSVCRPRPPAARSRFSREFRASGFGTLAILGDDVRWIPRRPTSMLIGRLLSSHSRDGSM